MNGGAYRKEAQGTTGRNQWGRECLAGRGGSSRGQEREDEENDGRKPWKTELAQGRGPWKVKKKARSIQAWAAGTPAPPSRPAEPVPGSCYQP